MKARAAKTVKEGLRINYLCHRSGHDRSKDNEDKERIRREQSVKIGARCPSSIISTQRPNGAVDVVFNKVHAGHTLGMQYLKLSKEERAQLAMRIKNNESLDAILDDVKNSESRTNFLSQKIIDRKDLRNSISDFDLDLDPESHIKMMP